MADLVDKFDILDPNSPEEKNPAKQQFRSNYRKLYEQSPKIFKQVDSLISEITDNPSKLKENSKKAWELLPQGGHPQGYFMSRTIIETLGKKILIAKMADPFEFVKLYNQAAAKALKKQKGDYYVFSEKIMNFLAGLQKNYNISKF